MTIATILPTGRTYFFDANSNPLAGGSVYMYVPPNTTTYKTTWQDAMGLIPNTNPIILDGDGSCLLYGSGQYLQEVYDVNNNLIYTALTQDIVQLIESSSLTYTGNNTFTGSNTFTQPIIAPNIGRLPTKNVSPTGGVYTAQSTDTGNILFAGSGNITFSFNPSLLGNGFYCGLEGINGTITVSPVSGAVFYEGNSSPTYTFVAATGGSTKLFITSDGTNLQVVFGTSLALQGGLAANRILTVSSASALSPISLGATVQLTGSASYTTNPPLSTVGIPGQRIEFLNQSTVLMSLTLQGSDTFSNITATTLVIQPNVNCILEIQAPNVWNIVSADNVGAVSPGSGATLLLGQEPKAWVNFIPSSATINYSYNVTSVTRNSTGNYTVNFATPISNYTPFISLMGVDPNTNAANVTYYWLGVQTSTTLQFSTGTPGGGGGSGGTIDLPGLGVLIV